MATYYFDGTNGNDSNPGTEALPKKNYEAASGIIQWNDILYFKRGTTQTITTIYRGITSNLRVYAYGTGAPPRWVASGAALGGGMILNMSLHVNSIFEDQDFDGTGVARTLYCAAQGATATSNVTFRRCLFHNCNADGVQVLQEPTASAMPSGYVFEDCEFYDNGGHGSFVMGTNHVHLRCKSYRNGATVTTGGHGFSARSSRTTVTSGWTLVSGNIYSRALAANELSVFAAVDSSGIGPLTQNTSTPTSPGSNQFGQSGTTLYVNVGSNPNSRTISYAWGLTSGLRYVDCEAWGTVWNVSTSYTEGHGFAADDWTANSQYVGCVSRDNEGFGFTFNQGTNNQLLGCVAYRNGVLGFQANVALNSVVRNCTFFQNNSGTRGPANVELLFNGATSTGCVASNNILIGSRATGIQFDGTAGGTAQNNAIYGYTTATSNGTVTGTITTDVRPYLNSDGSLTGPSNPLANAGVYAQGVVLANGRLRPNVVPVGAYMMVQNRPTRT